MEKPTPYLDSIIPLGNFGGTAGLLRSEMLAPQARSAGPSLPRVKDIPVYTRYLQEMKHLQRQQEELLAEFHQVCEYVSASFADNVYTEAYPDFPVHFPIPQHHAEEYPHVVCFWRATQKHMSLARLWSKWCSQHCVLSWSQVKPSTIQLFLSDVQVLCIHTLAATSAPILLSDTTWESLMLVFGSTDILSGSVWSPSKCRGAAILPAEHPFQPRLCFTADIRYPCSVMLPIFQCESTTRITLTVTHLSCYFQHPPVDRSYIALLPLCHEFSETLRHWEREGYAVLLASQVSLRKVVSRMPRYFAGDGICQWWLILPGNPAHFHVRLHSHDYHQSFSRLVQKHGGFLQPVPPRIMPIREFSAAVSTYFRTVYTAESSFRNMRMNASWDPKRRAIRSSFYIQYPRPVVDCAPNVTADRPAHWSAQSITGRGYSNMSLNVPCQKSSNVPFLGFFSVAESGYKSAAMYPNWGCGCCRTCR